MKEEKGRDRIFIAPPGVDGSSVAVRVSRDMTVSVGHLTPAEDGVALNGKDLVEVSLAEGGGLEVETVYSGRARTAGPAMVNSDGFRSGWDAVFGEKGDRSLN